MTTAALTERERDILKHVIEAYVSTAKPVSSGVVASHAGVDLSSATVRNVMRSLEEKGLIRQPHTSAGRVPTDAGYRYYVDRLMAPARLSDREKDRIGGCVEALRSEDLILVVTEVSRMVSELSKQLSIALAPGVEGGIVERFELVPLGGTRVMAVASTRSGRAKTRVFEARSIPRSEDIATTVDLVNRWLEGESLDGAERILRKRMSEVDGEPRRLLEALLSGPVHALSGQESDRLHYEGARYIFRHPEFSDDVSSLGRIFDSEQALADLVRKPSEPASVTITIGSENPRQEMRRMSLVVGSYRVGGALGRVGVVGPTRMRYPRLVSLIGYFSTLLDDLFSGS